MAMSRTKYRGICQPAYISSTKLTFQYRNNIRDVLMNKFAMHSKVHNDVKWKNMGKYRKKNGKIVAVIYDLHGVVDYVEHADYEVIVGGCSIQMALIDGTNKFYYYRVKIKSRLNRAVGGIRINMKKVVLFDFSKINRSFIVIKLHKR